MKVGDAVTVVVRVELWPSLLVKRVTAVHANAIQAQWMNAAVFAYAFEDEGTVWIRGSHEHSREGEALLAAHTLVRG